jgi:hypothetical protein
MMIDDEEWTRLARRLAEEEPDDLSDLEEIARLFERS